MSELIDQPMRLNYVLPDGEVVFIASVRDVNRPWVGVMAEQNPDTIFFLTVETTDIWEKEWDFNEVAMPVLDPEAPPGPLAGFYRMHYLNLSSTDPDWQPEPYVCPEHEGERTSEQD